MKKCSVKGCKRPYDCRGYCHTHYAEARRNGTLPILFVNGNYNKPKPVGYRVTRDRATNNHGYALIRIGPDDWRLEHRLVMEATLGRPLYKGERIHHKNGDRTDNRPENLELWLHTQPSGQRVEDLLAWAREIIRIYG